MISGAADFVITPMEHHLYYIVTNNSNIYRLDVILVMTFVQKTDFLALLF